MKHPTLFRACFRENRESVGDEFRGEDDLEKTFAPSIESRPRLLGDARPCRRRYFGCSCTDTLIPENTLVREIAKQLGLRPMLWSVDSLDWERPGVAAIVRNVLKSARNGGIVLMHDGGGDRSETVQALPYIISGLRQRDFIFVTR